MTTSSRDESILRHIIEYCDQISLAADHFGKNFDIFNENPVYRNAVSMCILQIGELVGNLTDDFKNRHPDIPWRQIKAMRNIVAHRYGTVDNEDTWSVVQDDIPDLKQRCTDFLIEFESAAF